jgi:DNA-binding response OmpR family regulator
MDHRVGDALVLIVEDEWFIAAHIAELILAAGFRIVGPTGHLAEAVELASREPIAAALLDIQLSGGDQVYPVAEALMARDIPFAFLSSRPRRDIDPVYRDVPCLGKPVEREALLAMLCELVGVQTESDDM